VTSFSPGKEATDAAPAAPLALASCTVARRCESADLPRGPYGRTVGGWFLGESKHFSLIHLLDSEVTTRNSETFQGSDL
jgi:hypothetical protein